MSERRLPRHAATQNSSFDRESAYCVGRTSDLQQIVNYTACLENNVQVHVNVSSGLSADTKPLKYMQSAHVLGDVRCFTIFSAHTRMRNTNLGRLLRTVVTLIMSKCFKLSAVSRPWCQTSNVNLCRRVGPVTKPLATRTEY